MTKIGIFDSGLGGLTILKSITQQLKGANVYYIADTKNAPYGEKSYQEILEFSLDITRYLIDSYEIDALIVACNTATSAAIEHIRRSYPKLIIIGVEPGIKPAIEQSISGHVGVLATPATLSGHKYKNLAVTLSNGKDITLHEQPCFGLVEQIESGAIDTDVTRHMLEEWLKPMREVGVDTIVLGCTHYPLVAGLIDSIMESRVKLIHTGEAITEQLLNQIIKIGHKNSGILDIRLFATDDISDDIVSYLCDKKFKRIDI